MCAIENESERSVADTHTHTEQRFWFLSLSLSRSVCVCVVVVVGAIVLHAIYLVLFFFIRLEWATFSILLICMHISVLRFFVFDSETSQATRIFKQMYGRMLHINIIIEKREKPYGLEKK